MIRIYFVPVDVYISPEGIEYRGPKYFKWRWNPAGLEVIKKGYQYYGGMGNSIVAVGAEVTQPQHDYLILQPDVFSFPINLDVSLIPSDISSLSSYLETSYVPADWITPADTWKTAIRTILAMFQLIGRYIAITAIPPWNDPSISFNAQFRNLPQYVRDGINQSFDDLNFDKSVIRSNWNLRIILKNAADQWGNREIRIGPFVF